jgi:pimeloyl-ACP methyl ester carboxylesterase
MQNIKSVFQENMTIPATANFVQQGSGAPVILIHGLAASLHDWDDLVPELAANGYACYAPDLLGHGDSPKLDSRTYQMDWILDHFFEWMKSLRLTEPAILIGHSLGGHIALEYARRISAWTRGLILVNPFYSRSQLPLLIQSAYGHTGELVFPRIPQKLFQLFVNVSSFAMGHSVGGLRFLPERIRAQTILDYKRTAPGVYYIPNVISDLTDSLHEVNAQTLVIWGDRDKTLSPTSFSRLVNTLPKARGEVISAGHVPHQSNTEVFNQMVMKFIRELP